MRASAALAALLLAGCAASGAPPTCPDNRGHLYQLEDVEAFERSTTHQPDTARREIRS